MSAKSRSHLGDSWVVNESDDGDGDVSWAEDEAHLVQEEDTAPSARRSVHGANRPRVGGKSLKSGQHNRHIPDPELIMPSLEPQTVQPRSRPQGRKQQANRQQIYDNKGDTVVNRQSTFRSSNHQSNSTSTDKVADVVGGSASWILDVVGQSLVTLKKPISWVLALYLFMGLMTLLQNLLTSSIYSAITPVCRIPGVSLLHLSVCKSPYASTQQSLPSAADLPAPEFNTLMNVQSQFETILTDTASGVALPHEMKRGETTIRDLRELVRYSHLPSKNELLQEFDGFIETARIASYDLQKFNSHVGRGVDIVLSTARWTQRVLDDINLSQSQRGLIPAFVKDTLLAPFQPVQFTESKLLDQYIQHTNIVSMEIESLIDEAQALLQVLNNLEDRLDVIQSVSIRDKTQTEGSKDEVWAQLWTYLGGNRAKLGRYNNQLLLLQRLGEQRKLAIAHVSSMILKLQSMSSELEALRDRVGRAGVLRDAGIDDVPLSVHIESIRLGVERLEIGREKARELEKDHSRRVIDGSSFEDSGRAQKYLVGG